MTFFYFLVIFYVDLKFYLNKPIKINLGEGKMELKIWAKSFFSIYRCLSTLVKSIDDFVEVRASTSFYSSLNRLTLCRTEKVFSDITALINKKITFLNIKCLVEKLLSSLPESSARFLVLKYIDGYTFEKTAESLEISTRTAMRWNITVLNRCSEILRSWGYSHKKMLEFVNHEKWIIDFYNKLLQEQNQHAKRVSVILILNDVQKECRKYMV